MCSPATYCSSLNNTSWSSFQVCMYVCLCVHARTTIFIGFIVCYSIDKTYLTIPLFMNIQATFFLL